ERVLPIGRPTPNALPCDAHCQKPSRFTVKSPPKLNVGFVAIFDGIVASAPQIKSGSPAKSATPLVILILRNLRRVTLRARSVAESCSLIAGRNSYMRTVFG